MSDNTVEIKVTADSAQVQEALGKAEAALKHLNEQVKGNTEGLAPLNTASRAVFEQYDKGLSTLNNAQNAFGHVTEALQKNEISGTQAVRMLAQLEHNAKEAAATTVNLGLSATQAANGARALVDELAAGRMRQATGTFTRLFLTIAEANPILAGAAGAVLAFAGAFAYLTIEAIKANAAIMGVNNAMVLTGRGAEFSEKQVQDYINSLNNLPDVSASSARGVVSAISRIPVATNETREALMQLAPALAMLTEKKPEEAAAELAKAFAGGADSLISFGKQFNLFSEDQIVALEQAKRTTDVYAAQRVAIEALNDRALKPYTEYIEKVRQYNQDMAAMSANALMNDAIVPTLKPPEVPKIGPGAPAEDPEHAREIAATERYNAVLRQRQAIEYDIALIEKRLAGELSDAQRQEAEGALKNAQQQLDALKNKGDASRLQEWKSSLLEQDAASDQSRRAQLRGDISYWQQILENQRVTGQERVEIENEISRAKTELRREDAAAIIADDKTKLEEDRRNGQQRLIDAQKLVDDAKRLYKEDSTQYQEALRIKEQVTREVNEQIRADNLQILESQRQAALTEVDILREKARLRESLTFEGAHQETALRLEAADRQYEIELDFLTREQSLYDKGTKQYDEYTRKLEALERTHSAERVKIEDDSLIASQRNWQRFFGSMTSGMGSAFTGLILRTENWKQAEAQIGQSLVSNFVQLGIKMVTNWTATEVAKTLISQGGAAKRIGLWLSEETGHTAAHVAGERTRTTVTAAGAASQTAVVTAGETAKTGVTIGGETARSTATAVGTETRVAMEAEGASESLAISAGTALKQVAIDAYQAAAGAYAAIAAIPFVGPFLAPIAAGVALASVFAIGKSIVSSEGGDWQVADDRVNLVHKDETILPAGVASPMRDFFTNGGAAARADGDSKGKGGGDMHFHGPLVHVAGSNSSPDQIARALQKAMRDFHPATQT